VRATMLWYILRLVSWIPFALPLPLIVLEQTNHEGYRPGPSELSVAATVVAVAAALLMGALDGATARPRIASVVLVTMSAALYLALHDLIFRTLVPVEDGDPIGTLGLVLTLVAALLGHLIAARARLGRGWYAVALIATLFSVFAVPEFLRIGAELSTTSFGPVGAATVALPAGRHGVYSLYGTYTCDVTADGQPIEVDRTAVPITDNSDSIVTVLVGTIRLTAPVTVTVSCDNAGLGPAPVFRSPMQTLVYGSRAVPWAIAAAPGLLLGLGVWLSRRGGTARRGSATGEPSALAGS
jgi:hypothetical protein